MKNIFCLIIIFLPTLIFTGCETSYAMLGIYHAEWATTAAKKNLKDKSKAYFLVRPAPFFSLHAASEPLASPFKLRNALQTPPAKRAKAHCEPNPLGAPKAMADANFNGAQYAIIRKYPRHTTPQYLLDGLILHEDSNLPLQC